MHLYDLHESIASGELTSEMIMGSIEQIMEDIPGGKSFQEISAIRQQSPSQKGWKK